MQPEDTNPNSESGQNKKRSAPIDSGRKKQRLSGLEVNQDTVSACICNKRQCIHDLLLIETMDQFYHPKPVHDDAELLNLFKNGPYTTESIQEKQPFFDKLLQAQQSRNEQLKSRLYGMSEKHKVAKALYFLFNFKVGAATPEDAFQLLLQCTSVSDETIRSIVNHYLGFCYLNGIGTPINYPTAVEHFEDAKTMGNSESLCSLGGCYEYGVGVDKDAEKAASFYNEAMIKGNVRGITSLATCALGGIGMKQNFDEAIRLNALGANRCDPRAQSNIGACAQYSTGLNVDPVLSVALYRIASEQGDARARYNLGYCLEEGIGVARNITQAIEHYKAAASHDLAPALFRLGLCYDLGKGMNPNPEKAVYYYTSAAHKGDLMALSNLGWCYEKGVGTVKNLDRARECYVKAVELGSTVAKIRIEHLNIKPETPRLTLKRREFKVKFPYESKGRSTLKLTNSFTTGLSPIQWGTIIDFVIKHDIKVLMLGENHIEEVPPGLKWELAKLEQIDLSDNRITSLPRDFAAQVQLTNLNLKNNPLNEDAADVVLALLANSPKLRQLDIGRATNVDQSIFKEGTSIPDVQINALEKICALGIRTRTSTIDYLNEGNFFRALDNSILAQDRVLRRTLKECMKESIYKAVLDHLLPLQTDNKEAEANRANGVSRLLTRPAI